MSVITHARSGGGAILAIALAAGALVAVPALPAAASTSSVQTAADATLLTRSGWSATASSEGFGYPTGHLFDGNDNTLWSTGNGQTPGQWLLVDLGSAQTFDTILLAAGTAPSDYPRSWSVTTSTDGATYSAAVTGTGALVGNTTSIAIGATAARYVRIEQTSGHFINAWSASEFNLSYTAPPAESIFGPNVVVFEPTDSASYIQSTMDAAAAALKSDEFTDERMAFLFKPGTYAVDTQVGYYTTVAGLGEYPGDVTIDGDIRVEGQVFNPSEFWVDNALTNFWRSIENLTIDPTDGESRWAVSQASPMRRVHIEGTLRLSPQYYGYSSGGYIADSVVDGTVDSGSQQQWLTRNSEIGDWSGAVWNQVFSGVTGAPTQSFPSPPITTLATTETSREKPFLYVDENDDYRVFVPALQSNSSGTTWESGSQQGTSISIDDFFIAEPGDSAATINAQLADGKNLLLTPGVYELDAPIAVNNANTVVLGLGVATLVPTDGDSALEVGDVAGVKLAGFMVDAGAVTSDTLVKVGTTGGTDFSANPTSLQDVYFRIGGARVGSAVTSLDVNSDDVLIDHIWAWRADHGAGAAWNTTVGDHGLVVNGDDVSAYGLFVEHYEKNQVVWNGENGRTVFYQSEIPYDVPSQAGWMDGTRNGYASYRVADDVQVHDAWGLGVYSYFNQGVDIQLESAIQVPVTSGVHLRDMVSVFLAGSGSVTHTVNDAGTVVQSGTMTSYVVDYVGPEVEETHFADAADTESDFYAPIQWMFSQGLSTGTPQSSGKPLYKPLDSVSRQAMAAFLYRLSGDEFTAPAEPTFADVPTSAAFYEAIEWMAAEGVSVGTPQPSGKPLYKPTDAVSRQAMALFLARYSGVTLSTPTTQSFADVPLDSAPAAAIEWMRSAGISTGTAQPSGLPLYKPADAVSRQAMAAFLYRLEHQA